MLKVLCSWLSPSSARPTSLYPFLSGSSALLLSFQDSELLGNFRLELRFSLCPHRDEEFDEACDYRCLRRKEDNSSNLPSPLRCLPETGNERSRQESKLCSGQLPSPLPVLLLPSPISKALYYAGPQNPPGALGLLLPHSDPQ